MWVYVVGCGSGWGWGWDLLSSGLLVLFLVGDGHRMGTYLPTLAHSVWLSGVPGPLGYWAGLLLRGLVVLMLVGPGSSTHLESAGRGPGEVSGLLPLASGLYLMVVGFCLGASLLSSGWMCGCPFCGLPRFCAPWGLLLAWVLGFSLPASDRWCGGWWPYTFITEHNSCKTCTIYFAHTHTHSYN